ncbi:hypothetical protein PHYBOEH_001630 [Phytophthora boehmeriae]|uniref:Uncharacterized protein n=1 Tax=Phytophthora boehmeriae TaxID=109152 RepID=A0A8T1WYQ2_9STRA|nr:hypothetical protein PHYBOEH_001630 [Phytophthora boehmeriae]
MIRSATSPGPAPGKSRAKQRSKKTFADADDADDFGNKQKAKYRRAAQKRREDVVAAVDEEDEHQTYHEMRELPLGPENLHLMQHLYQGQRYDAETRLLPDIEGLKTLTAHEAQTDIKSIQQQLAAFEARSGIKLLDRPSAIGDEGHRRLVLVDENDSDEDVAPLGGMLKNRRSRSNGVITPEEIVETLPAARRAVGEMKRMQKQNARVTRALSRDVIEKAKDLESSRRRNSALQDIMNELEARGNNVLRLTREKSRLEAMLEERDIELPEIDELDFGARAYVQEDNVEVLPSDVSYTEMEEQLKQRFFEKIGALVHPNEEDSEDSRPAVDVSQRKPKKRRLIMTASPGSTSKKPRNRRVIEFPASTIPITPYETGLLISPLSELPERVAAVGPGALQWLPSYLPKNMDEWEKERLSSLQMKGEIERLRFQLQRAEAEKQDAQEIASDQLESINQLVSQV